VVIEANGRVVRRLRVSEADTHMSARLQIYDKEFTEPSARGHPGICAHQSVPLCSRQNASVSAEMRNGRLFQNGREINPNGLAAAVNSAPIRFLSTLSEGDWARCRGIIAAASADVGPPPGHGGT
jgi:hypothetical protein